MRYMVSMTGKAPKRPRDPNQLAKLIVDIASGNEADAPIEAYTKAKGVPGANARTASLSPEERAEIARRAAKARWASRPNPG